MPSLFSELDAQQKEELAIKQRIRHKQLEEAIIASTQRQNQAIAKHLPPTFAIDKGWHKDHPKPSIDRGFQILPNDRV